MAKTKELNRRYASIRNQILTGRHAFEVLRVHASSTVVEINQARRMLAKYTHPDVNNAADAHDLTARLNVAHEQLTSGPVVRAQYMAQLGGKDCPACKGRGYNAKQVGFTKAVRTACTRCGGSGREIS